MALRSFAQWSSYVNPTTNSAGEYNELISARDPIKRSNIGNNRVPTKASTPPEVLIPTLILFPIEDFFIRFLKVFIETTKA